jgi:hypothetical protein
MDTPSSGPGATAPTAGPTSGVGTKSSVSDTDLSGGPARSADGTSIRAKLHTSQPSMSTPRTPPKPRMAGTKIPPVQVHQVAALRAEGLAMTKIGKALDLSFETVRNTLSLPETQLEITKRRQLLKGLTMDRLPGVSRKAWDMTEHVLDSKDAKGFDAMARGLASLEKVAASVTGEARQVEHSGHIETTPAAPLVELRALIALVKQST